MAQCCTRGPTRRWPPSIGAALRCAQRHIRIWADARLIRVGGPESPTGRRLAPVGEMSQRGAVPLLPQLRSSMPAREPRLRGPGWEGPPPWMRSARRGSAGLWQGPDGKVLARPGLHSMWARSGAGAVRFRAHQCGRHAGSSALPGPPPAAVVLLSSVPPAPSPPLSDTPAHQAARPGPGHHERRRPEDARERARRSLG